MVWWFWVGPMLRLAKCVPRGEAQGELTITTASWPAPNPPQRQSFYTTERIRHHYHSRRSKSTQLHVVIASSFACVASDVLGPAAKAPVAKLTLFYTRVRTRRIIHTHNTCARSSLCGNSPVFGVCEGLFSFESNTGGDFMDHTHTRAHTDSLC